MAAAWVPAMAQVWSLTLGEKKYLHVCVESGVTDEKGVLPSHARTQETEHFGFFLFFSLQNHITLWNEVDDIKGEPPELHTEPRSVLGSMYF